MTDTQHTPGPWHIEVDGNGWLSICQGGLIAELPDDPQHIVMPNARLIAAAPDLLEALEGLIHEVPLLSAKEKKAYAIARAAIAKATGK